MLQKHLPFFKLRFLCLCLLLLALFVGCGDAEKDDNNDNAIEVSSENGTDTSTDTSTITDTSTGTSTITDTSISTETGTSSVTTDPCLLDDGVGTSSCGKTYYNAQCASCHGFLGEGGSGPSLKTGCTLCLNFDFLRTKIETSMPTGNVSACEDACATHSSRYIFEGLPQ